VDATRDASSVDNMEDKVYGSVRCVRMGAMKRQEAADAAVAIPMPGMANSVDVATAAAILLYWLSLRFDSA
jgi:hypothetical protein